MAPIPPGSAAAALPRRMSRGRLTNDVERKAPLHDGINLAEHKDEVQVYKYLGQLLPRPIHISKVQNGLVATVGYRVECENGDASSRQVGEDREPLEHSEQNVPGCRVGPFWGQATHTDKSLGHTSKDGVLDVLPVTDLRLPDFVHIIH
jgi:hypothetical protein